jgi:hypothetical protein
MCLAILILALAYAQGAQARFVKSLDYSELFKKADWIVIAKPIRKSADTNERGYFDDLVSIDQSGKQSPVPAAGVETTFEVLEVVKGSKTPKHFVLHHYRDATPPSPGLAVDGPVTVSFDPSDPERRRDFLLFLVREKDGRYAPYGGQTDPGDRSIFALDGPP